MRDAQGYYTSALDWSPIRNMGPDMDMVNRISNNPYIDGMIDATSRDVTRNLYEDQMPGIAASAAGLGQAASSRRGAAEAIATRGAADRIADVGSNLRYDAYNRGLGIASDVASENARLAFQNRGQGLDAASNLRAIGDVGFDLMRQGDAARRGNFRDIYEAESKLQAQNQAEIDAQREKFLRDQQLPMEQLQSAVNIAPVSYTHLTLPTTPYV